MLRSSRPHDRIYTYAVAASKFTSKHGGTSKHVGAERGSCRCYSHTQSYAKLTNPFKITCAFYTDADATHVSTRTHSHTHLFTESLTYSLTHYLFTHPLTRSPPYSFTRSPNAHTHTRTLYPSRKTNKLTRMLSPNPH